MEIISKNFIKGNEIKNPLELIELANLGVSIYSKKWGLKPASVIIGMQFRSVCEDVKHGEFFYIIPKDEIYLSNDFIKKHLPEDCLLIKNYRNGNKYELHIGFTSFQVNYLVLNIGQFEFNRCGSAIIPNWLVGNVFCNAVFKINLLKIL